VIKTSLIFLSVLFSLYTPAHALIIYGEDDRFEVDDYSDNSFIEKARSVAIMVSAKTLKYTNKERNFLMFPQITLKTSYKNLCSNERFLEQVSIDANCTGFLVGQNKLVTAGHCIVTNNDCKRNVWVFDFKKDTTQFKINDVYSCKKIIKKKLFQSDKVLGDYAVIELDRPVLDREPLKFRKEGKIKNGTPLVVIGHPLGLPMKITDGGNVSRMNKEEWKHYFSSLKIREFYFTANLDTYGGNSGSPVFNQNTGVVEGILIQGADDFVYNTEKRCRESARRTDGRKTTEETIMRITEVPGLE
jgi:V8-like Glu-specific endopeptidase